HAPAPPRGAAAPPYQMLSPSCRSFPPRAGRYRTNVPRPDGYSTTRLSARWPVPERKRAAPGLPACVAEGLLRPVAVEDREADCFCRRIPVLSSDNCVHHKPLHNQGPQEAVMRHVVFMPDHVTHDRRISLLWGVVHGAVSPSPVPR